MSERSEIDPSLSYTCIPPSFSPPNLHWNWHFARLLRLSLHVSCPTAKCLLGAKKVIVSSCRLVHNALVVDYFESSWNRDMDTDGRIGKKKSVWCPSRKVEIFSLTPYTEFRLSVENPLPIYVLEIRPGLSYVRSPGSLFHLITWSRVHKFDWSSSAAIAHYQFRFAKPSNIRLFSTSFPFFFVCVCLCVCVYVFFFALLPLSPLFLSISSSLIVIERPVSFRHGILTENQETLLSSELPSDSANPDTWPVKWCVHATISDSTKESNVTTSSSSSTSQATAKRRVCQTFVLLVTFFLRFFSFLFLIGTKFRRPWSIKEKRRAKKGNSDLFCNSGDFKKSFGHALNSLLAFESLFSLNFFQCHQWPDNCSKNGRPSSNGQWSKGTEDESLRQLFWERHKQTTESETIICTQHYRNPTSKEITARVCLCVRTRARPLVDLQIVSVDSNRTWGRSEHESYFSHLFNLLWQVVARSLACDKTFNRGRKKKKRGTKTTYTNPVSLHVCMRSAWIWVCVCVCVYARARSLFPLSFPFDIQFLSVFFFLSRKLAIKVSIKEKALCRMCSYLLFINISALFLSPVSRPKRKLDGSVNRIGR